MSSGVRPSRMWSTCSSSCFERRGVVRHLGVPGLEVGLSELEDAEAAVLTRGVASVQVELLTPPRLPVVELLDDAPDALLGDVGDGRVVFPAWWAREAGRG